MRPLLSENAVKLLMLLIMINIILHYSDENQSERSKWQMQFAFGVIQFVQLLCLENKLDNCKTF